MPPLSRGLLRARAAFLPLPFAQKTCYRRASTHNQFIKVSEEVQDALETGKPVVALETTIYTHGKPQFQTRQARAKIPLGFPFPENIALSSHLESLVRINGGIPATIGILNGTAKVGLGAEELAQLVSTAGSKDTWKISRRDLGFIGGLVMLLQPNLKLGD
jgi:pseudouridylate synthase / pseudouridine kinase